jgi:hypothetical protein
MLKERRKRTGRRSRPARRRRRVKAPKASSLLLARFQLIFSVLLAINIIYV